jgi:hypothetical protein
MKPIDMACELCTKLLEAFKTPIDDEVETPLGPHHQIMKTTCQQCHDIRERVYLDCCYWINELRRREIHPHALSIKVKRHRNQQRLQFWMSYPKGGWTFSVELVRGASTPW